MDNIDEKIAKIKMQQREEKQKILNKETKEEKEKHSNETMKVIEDVIKQMSNGTVRINNNTFVFRKKSYLNGKLEMPMPLNYFIEKINEENNFTLVNDLHGVSFNASYIEENVKKQKLSEFKEGMKQGFKAMKIYAEWLEEGSFGDSEKEKINYLTYKTSTSKGNIYNLIFYRQYKETMLIGNYNCFYKEIDTWEPLIKASILMMNIE